MTKVILHYHGTLLFTSICKSFYCSFFFKKIVICFLKQSSYHQGATAVFAISMKASLARKEFSDVTDCTSYELH